MIEQDGSRAPTKRSGNRPINKQKSAKAPALARPMKDDREAWKAYWRAQGQAWRTESAIDPERQKYLAERSCITPNIEKGVYPFKGIEPKLTRADVEWLLAAYEGRWKSVNSGDKEKWKGLDLRGADLQRVDLQNLPLKCMYGGLESGEWVYEGKLEAGEWEHATDEQRSMAAVIMEGANLKGAQLDEAILNGARLHRANLISAQLEGACLREAQLEGARLSGALLKEADLRGAQLNRALFSGAQLNGAYLVEAQLNGADLSGAELNGAVLIRARLNGAYLIDTQLNGAVLESAGLSRALLYESTGNPSNCIILSALVVGHGPARSV